MTDQYENNEIHKYEIEEQTLFHIVHTTNSDSNKIREHV